MVVKEAYGSFGAQVYLAKNRSELDALRNRLKYMPHLYQRYVKNSSGEDIRIIVVGGKAVAAMKRKNKGDFRANIELGGVGENIFRVQSRSSCRSEFADCWARTISALICFSTKTKPCFAR